MKKECCRHVIAWKSKTGSAPPGGLRFKAGISYDNSYSLPESCESTTQQDSYLRVNDEQARGVALKNEL